MIDAKLKLKIAILEVKAKFAARIGIKIFSKALHLKTNKPSLIEKSLIFFWGEMRWF